MYTHIYIIYECRLRRLSSLKLSALRMPTNSTFLTSSSIHCQSSPPSSSLIINFFNRLRWAAAHTGKTSKIRLPKATPSPPYPCPPHPFARSCCKFKYLKQSLLHPLAAPASATFLAIARPQLHSSSSFDRPHPPSGQDPKRTHTWLIFFFISVFFRPDLSSMSVCRRRLRLWLRFGFVSNWQLLAYFTWHRSLNALKMHPTKKSTT